MVVTDKINLPDEPRLLSGPVAVAAAFATLGLVACGGGHGAQEALLKSEPASQQPDLLPRTAAASTSGARRKASAARTPTATEVFDWAQLQFPSIFSSQEANIAVEGLTYRFYPGTGHYLGVLDGNVVVLGPLTDN
ncbi:MAG: hypothetical protein CFE44_25055, partial [Burkholderiales bacterium PBB4]